MAELELSIHFNRHSPTHGGSATCSQKCRASLLDIFQGTINGGRAVIEQYLRQKKIGSRRWEANKDALLPIIHRKTSESRQLMDEFNSKLDTILKLLDEPTELERRMAWYTDAAGGIEQYAEQDPRFKEPIALSDEWVSTLPKRMEDIEFHTQCIVKRLESRRHEPISNPCLGKIWANVTFLSLYRNGAILPRERLSFVLSASRSEDIRVEFSADQWTLKFLDLPYQRALLDSINTNCTGFVSVEVNKFIGRIYPPGLAGVFNFSIMLRIASLHYTDTRRLIMSWERAMLFSSSPPMGELSFVGEILEILTSIRSAIAGAGDSNGVG
ncbi:uncharacterized protein EI90DRAFT_3010669 [Cantharellus anzutake]|uniref:uncharacterized protein n=1 Tax=Cantharellus anzutake TaxID=1750568 RepID=UPI0019056F7D|nr:uncharacterized protein EI90DRAFT_3010669 [Cantharellus anzutake]KAF8343781.1 hypothetical protein EI90DRAFT_3010669 [Cantharellus anzutake]